MWQKYIGTKNDKFCKYQKSGTEIYLELALWATLHQVTLPTRMHSSRMRIARLLTPWAGGVCIPACTGQGGVSQHALGRWRLPRGVCPGVGGICPGGSVRGCVTDTPLWAEWQTGVKTLPCCNFVAGSNDWPIQQWNAKPWITVKLRIDYYLILQLNFFRLEIMNKSQFIVKKTKKK